MGIPYRFDPLGTLGGGELPYVQPIMTSLTDWSNKTGPGAASFGLSMTASPNIHLGHDAWYALRGDSTEDNRIGWFIRSGAEGNTIITFEGGKAVKLMRLEYYTENSVTQFFNNTLTVYALENGEWVQKGQYTSALPYGTKFGLVGFDLESPVYANQYKLVVQGQNFSTIMNMKLIGTFRK